jgi:hypothetical protein
MKESRRMELAGQVARIRKMKNAYKMLSESLKGGNNLEDLGVGERILLETMLQK